MYSSLCSLRNALRSSSLISLLARNHGDLRTSRSLSAIITKDEGSRDNFKTSQMNQNPICDEDTTQKLQDNPKISIYDIISVLTQQRSKSRWSHLHFLRPNGFAPEEFSQIVIRIKNNPHLALRFFLWTQKKSLCNHNIGSYSTIIHVLARGRLKQKALLLIREAIRISESDDLKSDLKPLKVFETLVKTYTQCGSAPFVFDLLIEACLDSKKIESAIQIVRMLLSRGISPSYGTCNSLLRQVSRRVGADKGYGLFKEIFGLKNSRVRLSVEILNTLMVAFYQEGALEKVKDIWDELIQSDCDPNCCSFSILMAAYCDEGKMDKVEELWENMKAKRVEFDVVAYNTIIGGFCLIGETEKAEEYFREMVLSEIDSSSTTYEHLLKGYCKTGNLDSAMLIYKDMIRRDFEPEVFTIDELIRELCLRKRIPEALDILRCTAGSVRSCLTRETFEVLIVGLCREGKMEEALKLQAEMVAEGFEPSREIYGAFISGYEEQGNVEMTSKLRNEMWEAGLNS